MLFFHMLLQPLAAVSCHLQENSVDLLFAIASFESFHTAIDKLSVEGWGNPETSELSKLMSLDAESTFKGIQLSGNKIAIVSAFKTSILSYVQKLKSCVYDSLKDLEERDIFKALKLLEIGTWPKNKEALDIFGHQELSLLCDHFNTILLKNEVDIQSTASEWDAFKNFCSGNLLHLPKEKIWSLLITDNRLKYPNLGHLFEILLVFPVSNAAVERGFSAMKRIKTDWRCKLNEDTLDHLMRISIEGPPLSSFNPTDVVQRFFATTIHPNWCTTL